MPDLRLPALIIGLTIAAGVLDAFAFTYSADVWQGGRLVWERALRAAASFALAIILYWGAVRYMGEAGVVQPEIQTLIWFAVTVIGVTVLGGRFLHWHLLDQIVALNVIASLAWLIRRTTT